MTPAHETMAHETAALARDRGESNAEYRAALLHGLGGPKKSIPCKFFYDEAGSKLFETITALSEYYPTRTEFALLSRHGGEFAALIGKDAEIVEFGAGSSDKIRLLLDSLASPRAYLPVDISGPYIMAVAAKLAGDYPRLSVRPVIADFAHDLVLPPRENGVRRVGFFPGSTIGNFQPDEARAFLSHTASLLKGGGLLIGVDLVKDPRILHAAYNDSAGITAAFNKNLLVRANREAGANFEPSRFFHYAPYNAKDRRIEMYLVSRSAQRVAIAGHKFGFAEGEAIHTEYSHKFTMDGFRRLAGEAGFIPRAAWCDPDKLFSLHWLEAA